MLRRVLSRAGEALRYAAARGKKAIGAALGGLTGEAVVRLGGEWFDVTVDPAVGAVIAMGLAALGAWLAPENAPKRETATVQGIRQGQE